MSIYTVHKSSQTARSNTFTLADDPELIFASMPAGVYRARLFLQFQGSITGSQGAQFSIRAGSGHPTSGWLTAQGIANNSAWPLTLYQNGGAVVQLSNISTALFDCMHIDAVFGHAGGDIALQWAQRSLSANATLLNAYSWFELMDI
jgi:hypothetical protein